MKPRRSWATPAITTCWTPQLCRRPRRWSTTRSPATAPWWHGPNSLAGTTAPACSSRHSRRKRRPTSSSLKSQRLGSIAWRSDATHSRHCSKAPARAGAIFWAIVLPRSSMRVVPWVLGASVMNSFLACGGHPPAQVQSPAALAVAESLDADLRDTRDRIDVRLAADPDAAARIASQITRYNFQRAAVASRLGAVDSASLSSQDARALGVMRRTLARDLDSLSPAADSGSAARAKAPACGYDPTAILQQRNGLDSLQTLIYTCYAWSQSHIVLGRDTLDRLTVLGSLARTEDAKRRRELFLALDPVWQTMNRDNTPGSPYRQLIAAEVRSRHGQESPAAGQARASGVSPDSLEHWLHAILQTWRDGSPDSLVD